MHNRRLCRAVVCLVFALFAGSALGQTGLPKLVTEPTLRGYLTKYLVLSEAQSAEVMRLHAAYQESWATEFNAETLELQEKWNGTYASIDKFTGESMALAYKEIVELVERVSSRRKVANDLFFDSIEAILSEQQLPGMQRVRSAHDRLSFHNKSTQPRGLRERDIEVIALLEQMTLSPEERAAVEPVVCEFEPSYVALMRDAVAFNFRREQLIFGAMEIARQMILHPNPGNADGGDEARMREGNRLGSEADRVAFGSQKRLVEANRRALRLFAAAITPESAKELVRRYNERSYPEVLPDPVRANVLYEQAFAAIGDKDPDRLAALQASLESYVREHDQLSEKMTEAVYAMAALPFELSIKYKGSDFGLQYSEEVSVALAKSEERLRTLGLEREKLNLSQPARIRALLLPEEVAVLPVWRFEKSTAPRPWGRLADAAETKEIQKATRQYEVERRNERNGVPSTQPSTTQPATAPQ